MAGDTDFPSMGATVFGGLLVLTLITQGQPEIEYAVPYETMDGLEFTDEPRDVSRVPPLAWTLHFTLADDPVDTEQKETMRAPSPAGSIAAADVQAARRPEPSPAVEGPALPGQEPFDAVVPAPLRQVTDRTAGAFGAIPRVGVVYQVASDELSKVVAQFMVDALDAPAGGVLPDGSDALDQTLAFAVRPDLPTPATDEPFSSQPRPPNNIRLQSTVAVPLAPLDDGFRHVHRPRDPDVALRSADSPASPSAAGQASVATRPADQPDVLAGVSGQAQPTSVPLGHRSVPGAFTRPRPAVPPATLPLPPSASGLPRLAPKPRPALVTGDFVFLREAPFAGAAPLGQFDIGTEALLLEERGLWRRVTIGDLTGWMFVDYLSPNALE